MCVCVCVDARYTGGLLSKQTASVGRIDSTTSSTRSVLIMNDWIDSQRVKKAQKKLSEEEVGVGGRKRRRIGEAEKRRIEEKKKKKRRKEERKKRRKNQIGGGGRRRETEDGNEQRVMETEERSILDYILVW